MTTDEALAAVLPHVPDGFAVVILTRADCQRAYWGDMEHHDIEDACKDQLVKQGVLKRSQQNFHDWERYDPNPEGD